MGVQMRDREQNWERYAAVLFFGNFGYLRDAGDGAVSHRRANSPENAGSVSAGRFALRRPQVQAAFRDAKNARRIAVMLVFGLAVLFFWFRLPRAALPEVDRDLPGTPLSGCNAAAKRGGKTGLAGGGVGRVYAPFALLRHEQTGTRIAAQHRAPRG